MSRYCTGLHRIYNRDNRRNHKRVCGYSNNKKRGWGWGWRVLREWPWRNSRANGHHSRGTNRRWLDGDECFPIVPEDEEEDVGEAVPGNEPTLGILAGFWLFKNASFYLFYDMDHSVIQAVKLKQMVEGGLLPCRHTFRQMKEQKVRYKLQCISVRLHQVCMPLLPPLLYLFHLFHLSYPKTFMPTPCLPPPLQLTQCENKSDENLYDDLLPVNE